MISIECFPALFVPNPRVELPERDVFGVLHGNAYQPMYGPERSKTAMAGNEYDMKTGRATVFHSLLENILDFRLMMNPFVIEVRSHYPMSLEPKVLRRLGWGERLLESEVATIDRVITLQRKDNHQLHLHAISVKPEGLLEDSTVIRRHERERLYAVSRGASWETIGSSWCRKHTSTNLALVRSWCLESDVGEYYGKAEEFTWRLKKGKPVGSLEERVLRVAKAMGCTRLEAYRFFGVAVAAGLLAVDDNHRLRIDFPLHLLKAGGHHA
ncbi:conserved hypothetical protein [Cupriavidus taiwanensis]|uniref:TnsA endonuclease N-terminal domain-containing protein n=1 Tax=Cupriavidus taiwanensis TaxID=164546 RepID=A0A976G580_9BURK|nr:hypothetical protein [Cupriavidus taiwanensis]SOZ68625.1 conserved hypothetical protein [Cupriavidus taiwanensis]SOZ69771.1 conserved hypothetical protein [Cupriavidus taiwanensis]SOZ72953.1 conserved hypothetical protein [Cupriavidus taiwanensis]SPA09860.1 conserved hypothetical protein [Cupriavidus taiwanensis]SPA23815.1 conserved hypothetical protein [Cupriavidus taiwanensis]